VSPPSLGESEVPAIQALLEEIKRAWAASDAELLARPFSADANFVAFDGTRLKGRAAIAVKQIA
jgi:uncharacterized protein (TIGR02246 family)